MRVKKAIFICVILLIFSSIIYLFYIRNKEARFEKRSEDYQSYFQEASDYCKNKGLCTDFFILVDYSIHSGKKRMYIYDFKEKRITDRFLVSHGSGKSSVVTSLVKEKPTFSNILESHCSSLGKYILGKKKVPSTGYKEKYLLYGQEATNSNALKRNIVFHPWSVMPDFETYPSGVPKSWGCPAVSKSVFNKIDKKIQSTKKNILFWIIYPEN